MQTTTLKIGQQEIEFKLPTDFQKNSYVEATLFAVTFLFDAHQRNANFRLRSFDDDWVRQKKDPNLNGYCPVITFKDRESAAKLRDKLIKCLVTVLKS